jgi:hypothetical protein
MARLARAEVFQPTEGGTLGTHHLCVLRLDEGHLGISNSGI